jgi:hypothetical protein
MKIRALSTVVIVALALGIFVAGYGQGFPLGLLPTPPSDGEPISVFVWTDVSVVNIGDEIVIHLQLSRPGFVYLFDLQPDGLVRLIFPNAFSVNNYVASSSYDLPDGPYKLTVTPPAGIEEFLVFACDTPLPILVGSAQDPFPIYAMDATEAINQLVALFGALEQVPTWGMGWHAIQIVGDQPTEPKDNGITLAAPPVRPPFNGRPGNAWHMVRDSWQMGIPESGWYWYFDINARWHLCLVIQ